MFRLTCYCKCCFLDYHLLKKCTTFGDNLQGIWDEPQLHRCLGDSYTRDCNRQNWIGNNSGNLGMKMALGVDNVAAAVKDAKNFLNFGGVVAIKPHLEESINR